jgi:predicted dehydrogenase
MLRVGLIGYGRRGAVLASLLRSIAGAQLAAVGDGCATARDRAHAETGQPAFDPSSEGWPVDAPDLVLVATPAGSRATLLGQVVRPGVRTVLVEKPVALTLLECDQMQRACDAAGARLFVAHHWRFCADLAALRQIVQSGRLGKIDSIHATAFGNLLDQGCHLLDAIRWVLGGVAVQWATAQGTNDRNLLTRLGGPNTPVEPDPHHPAPMWTNADLALAGDVRVQLSCGPLVQRTNAPLGDWHERRFHIQGTRGSAECRPGHYLRLQIPGDDTPDMTLHPSSLDAATLAMLQAACDAVRHESSVATSASDARQTLEGLLLCGASLRDGVVALAPLPAHDNPYVEVAARREYSVARRPSPQGANQKLRFSVLIPLVEERGFGERCLQGWLAQQDFPAEGYELVVLDNGTAASLRERLRPTLRPQDRILLERGAGRSELFDCGARAALGEYVLLTESHCVPEPDMLREFDRYLQRYAVDGACCRSVPVCYNELARADAALFESGFRQFRRDDDWRKVNIHGFALRRDLYELVGGLQTRYHEYAEMVLAADLRDAGVRLGYAAGAAVQHHYRIGLQEIAECADGFVRGELQYLADHGKCDRIGFSFLEMRGGAGESATARRACARAEWERLRRDGRRGDFSAIGPLTDLARGELLDRWPGELASQLRLALATLACWWTRGDDDRLLAAYSRLFSAAVDRAWRRSRHLTQLPAARSTVTLSPADLPTDWLFGFYPVETSRDRRFRWSRPVAGIDLPLSPGEYVIEIETGGIRPWPGSLRWTMCGRPLASDDVEYATDRCKLRIAVPERLHAGRHTLGFSCLPWDVVEWRALGLPIFQFTCQRADSLSPADAPVLLAMPAAGVAAATEARAA